MKKLLQKGNKQLRVDEARAEDYLKAGYVEIDQKTGKPVAVKKTDDTKALKAENTALKKENAELKAQVENLTARLAAKPVEE